MTDNTRKAEQLTESQKNELIRLAKLGASGKLLDRIRAQMVTDNEFVAKM